MAEIPVDPGKNKLFNGFMKLLSNIGEKIADAASLEVTTFTGDFEYKASEILRNGVDKVEIEKVLKQLTISNNANLKLIAYTNVKIDSDISTIVKSDLSESDAELLKLHKEMMQSSKESRQSIIQLVMDLIPKP